MEPVCELFDVLRYHWASILPSSMRLTDGRFHIRIRRCAIDKTAYFRQDDVGLRKRGKARKAGVLRVSRPLWSIRRVVDTGWYALEPTANRRHGKQRRR
jgi:hypothetical protein